MKNHGGQFQIEEMNARYDEWLVWDYISVGGNGVYVLEGKRRILKLCYNFEKGYGRISKWKWKITALVQNAQKTVTTLGQNAKTKTKLKMHFIPYTTHSI